MPGIFPNIACHHLVVDPMEKWTQSDEKSEATSKIVDLIRVNFVKENKYTTWLSNAILFKKASGK